MIFQFRVRDSGSARDRLSFLRISRTRRFQEIGRDASNNRYVPERHSSKSPGYRLSRHQFLKLVLVHATEDRSDIGGRERFRDLRIRIGLKIPPIIHKRVI